MMCRAPMVVDEEEDNDHMLPLRSPTIWTLLQSERPNLQGQGRSHDINPQNSSLRWRYACARDAQAMCAPHAWQWPHCTSITRGAGLQTCRISCAPVKQWPLSPRFAVFQSTLLCHFLHFLSLSVVFKKGTSEKWKHACWSIRKMKTVWIYDIFMGIHDRDAIISWISIWSWLDRWCFYSNLTSEVDRYS